MWIHLSLTDEQRSKESPLTHPNFFPLLFPIFVLFYLTSLLILTFFSKEIEENELRFNNEKLFILRSLDKMKIVIHNLKLKPRVCRKFKSLFGFDETKTITTIPMW